MLDQHKQQKSAIWVLCNSARTAPRKEKKKSMNCWRRKHTNSRRVSCCHGCFCPENVCIDIVVLMAPLILNLRLNFVVSKRCSGQLCPEQNALAPPPPHTPSWLPCHPKTSARHPPPRFGSAKPGAHPPRFRLLTPSPNGKVKKTKKHPKCPPR